MNIRRYIDAAVRREVRRSFFFSDAIVRVSNNIQHLNNGETVAVYIKDPNVYGGKRDPKDFKHKVIINKLNKYKLKAAMNASSDYFKDSLGTIYKAFKLSYLDIYPDKVILGFGVPHHAFRYEVIANKDDVIGLK